MSSPHTPRRSPHTPRPIPTPTGPTPTGPAPGIAIHTGAPLPGPGRATISDLPPEIWRNMADIILAENNNLPAWMDALRNLAQSSRRLRNLTSLAHYMVAKDVCPHLLTFGAWRGDLNILKLGIDAGMDINTRTCQRRVLRTHCDFVFNRTADTRRDIMQSMSATPLHWAIVMGHNRALQLLLGYIRYNGTFVQADLQETCNRMCKCWFSGTIDLPNFTPLHLAICQGRSLA